MAMNSPFISLLLCSLFFLEALVFVSGVRLEDRHSLDPLKHRGAREKVDLEARLEYYRKKIKDDNGCPPPLPSPDNLPTVPDSFSAEVEISFEEDDQRKVIYGQEKYDGVLKKGLLNYQLAEILDESRPDLIAESIYYTVEKNEALFELENDGCPVTGQEDCNSAKNCSAGTLNDMTKELENLFGVIAHPGHSGFYGASSILEFGAKYNYTQSSEETCHGLDCKVYQTCIYVAEENATLYYTYYWSEPDWYMGNNDKQVPIAVEIFGDHEIPGHTTKSIARRYDFFNYQRDIIPSSYDLEPTQEVYCYGRKSEFEPPQMDQAFFMDTEIVSVVSVPDHPGQSNSTDTKYNVVFPKTEYYDYNLHITRQEYIPIYLQENPHQFLSKTTFIQEFNQDLAYVIQPVQEMCEIRKVKNVTTGDIVFNDDGSIFLVSPWHYGNLDMPLQFNGNHWSRGLDAGVWVGMKTENGVAESYVWYYASPLTHDLAGKRGLGIEFPTVDHVPVKMEKYTSFVPNYTPLTYNIYNYESQVPHVHNHDISQCYEAKNMKDLLFHMPEDSIDKTKHLIENYKYGLMLSLSKVGKVSPLRINNVDIRPIPDAVEVVFTLLERPDVIAKVKMADKENLLKNAYKAIQTTIDSSQLIVEVVVGDEFGKPKLVQVVALPHTLQETQRDNGIFQSSETTEGYSPGDMAVLGLCMAFIGSVFGAVLLHRST